MSDFWEALADGESWAAEKTIEILNFLLWDEEMYQEREA